MGHFLTFLADFGDSAVLIGLVIGACLYLLWCKHFQEALALAGSLLVSASVITGLKLIMLSCGHGQMNIHSPSGHSAMSIAVYGTFGLILSKYFKSWHRKIPPVLFLALGFVIAISRVIMNLHSIGEVIIGMIVGLAVIVTMWFFLLRKELAGFEMARKFNVYILLGLIVLISLAVHGFRLQGEQWIQKAAWKIRHSLEFCQ